MGVAASLVKVIGLGEPYLTTTPVLAATTKPKPVNKLFMAKLILIRHCLSEYNASGLWTGWDDPSLTEEGHRQARTAAEALTDIPLDTAFVPPQKRSKETLAEILNALHKSDIPVTEDRAIMERNYGVYTGKNKWDIQKKIGEDAFRALRRGWDYPVPEGESLKQVYERFVPYFTGHILPELTQGKNVIIVTSGNALRSLVKYLDKIPDDKIADFQIAVGEILVYTINEDGNVSDKERRNATNPVP